MFPEETTLPPELTYVKFVKLNASMILVSPYVCNFFLAEQLVFF